MLELCHPQEKLYAVVIFVTKVMFSLPGTKPNAAYTSASLQTLFTSSQFFFFQVVKEVLCVVSYFVLKLRNYFFSNPVFKM